MRVEIVKKVLQSNDNAANENRARFDAAGVTCINLLGGAGCGKTTLLEATLPRLTDGLRIAVFEGDLATTRDAERVAALGVPAVQLLTDGGCHLTATLVQEGLQRIAPEELDLLIVENVGNLICPASFDLGEHARIAVLSVAEGHDKPVKYPLMFTLCEAIIVNKIDMLSLSDFDMAAFQRAVTGLNQKARIFQVSCKTGEGMDGWISWLESELRNR